MKITNNCSRIAQIELVLLSTNRAILVEKKDIPLLETQHRVDSLVLTHTYEMTLDSTLMILAKFTRVKFVYDMRQNRADLFISDKVLQYLERLMPEDVRTGLAMIAENESKSKEMSEANV